ncbi:MAG: Txe/YoeB family addiction module toxin [bacterium]
MKKQQSLTDEFLRDYAFWLKNNSKIAQKIDKIIDNIDTKSLINFHKGEKLKYCPNRYSCRIDKKNRLIYEKNGDIIKLLSCKGHYEDK